MSKTGFIELLLHYNLLLLLYTTINGDTYNICMDIHVSFVDIIRVD